MNNTKKNLINALAALALLIVTASADAKKCPGGTCSVPYYVNCDYYFEYIDSSPQSGQAIQHTGVVKATWEISNCHSGNSTKEGHQSYTQKVDKTVSHTITAGVEVGHSVKVAAGVGPLASAEAAAQFSTSIDAGISDADSTSEEHSGQWNFSVPACYIHSARLLADWTDGSYSKRAWVHAEWWEGPNLDDPRESTQCSQAEASSEWHCIKRDFGIKRVVGNPPIRLNDV